MTSAADIAGYIERYLEADDTGSNGTNGSAATFDGGARQQLQAISRKTDQLQQDTSALQKRMASIESGAQIAAILPLLGQSLKVVSDPGGNLSVGETIEFQQADPLMMVLPFMMGSMGDSSGSGTDNSTNMLLLALVLSGQI